MTQAKRKEEEAAYDCSPVQNIVIGRSSAPTLSGQFQSVQTRMSLAGVAGLTTPASAWGERIMFRNLDPAWCTELLD